MKPHRFKPALMGGFSLVELMVALTIGLIIMAAVSTLFVSSKQTYTAQDQLARLQENARFAMQFIMSDLRLGGYYGCLDDVTDKNVFSVVNSTSLAYSIKQAVIEGMENASGTWYPSGVTTDTPPSIRAGTDAIIIRFADPSASVDIVSRMPNKSAPLTVALGSTFNKGQIIMVADCTSADLMQITNDVTGNTLEHGPGGADSTKIPPWPGNTTPTADLSKAYDVPAKVMRFSTRRYYIRDNVRGIPSLYRDNNGGTAEEMVEGIESLQILYGVDTDDPLDGVPNKYVKASAVGATNAKYGWSAVIAVRIGIIARTIDNKETEIDNRSYDADGDNVDDLAAQNDRYKRRIFQATVQLRNML